MVDQISATDSGNGTADQDRKWYVIHTYSGYENKVKTNLEHRIESMGVQDKIFQVVIPTEEEIEIKDGQRRTVQKKVYPGYVMVEMSMDDDAWYVVRNTPGVLFDSGTWIWRYERNVPKARARVLAAIAVWVELGNHVRAAAARGFLG